MTPRQLRMFAVGHALLVMVAVAIAVMVLSLSGCYSTPDGDRHLTSAAQPFVVVGVVAPWIALVRRVMQ